LRTLVISDLHIGSRLGRDVLRHPEALAILLGALDDVDRLVLLGDVVELAEGRPREAMRIAEPILKSIGRRMGPERPIVLVPGNHDRSLTRAWAVRQGDALKPDTLVPAEASRTLATVLGWLKPAEVEVRTPGVWLTPRVFAHHGHYLDRHLLPNSAWGRLSPEARHGDEVVDVVGPLPYERRRAPRPPVETRRLPRRIAMLMENIAEMARAATMPSPRKLQPHRIAPLTSLVLGRQMQRAAIPALAHAMTRIGVQADWLVFGHVHRLGPLPGDDASLWQSGPTRIANTGSWIYEPLVLHHRTPPHPYWPGGAILIENDTADPQPLSLLDDLDVATLFRSRPPSPALQPGRGAKG
jgi:UDP-2,3-diacylglucosamine pyrophosphatase LpxH